MNNNLDYLKKYKLYIVDYDGTLIDSMGMWEHLLSNFLKDNNIAFEEDIDLISKEQTNFESVRYVHDKYFKTISYEDLENMMYEYVKKQYVLQKEKAGSRKLLSELKKYGKVVLFSATANELLSDSFKTNGLNEYFDYVYSASNMNTTKTNGIGFLKIIDIEKIKKEDTLIVEDIYHAIKGAKNQGFDTLAIYDNQDNWNEIINISNYSLNYKDLN